MRKKYFLSAFVLVYLFFETVVFCFAETIVLKNGDTVEGLIVEKTDKYVKVTIDGTPTTFFTDEIQEIRADAKGSSSVLAKEGEGTPPEDKENKELPPGQKSMLLYQQAMEKCSQKAYKEGEELFKQSLVLSNQSASGFDGFPENALRTLHDFQKGVISEESLQLAVAAAKFCMLQDFGQALPLFEKFTQMNPEYSVGLQNLGMIYAGLGLFEKAVPILQKSLGLEENPYTRFALGGTYAKLGNFQGSKENFDKAKELFTKGGKTRNAKFVEAFQNKIPQEK